MQVTVVTLLVTPEEAERLTLASTEGKIQLALRNPLDTGSPDTPGIGPACCSVHAQSRSRETPPLRRDSRSGRPPPTIEIIRGDKRSQVAVG